ncbi:hypothetical protein COX99_00810 [Candidatus Pacearchaeota archaeon CG_4_10_14_0_2_um_filter_31_10]|nr:MAG: hypothetical protein COX99_00810 [Candidatus Pacearchaeota archaeon CG_4_10_14_0_2_um_filter_31_10]
MAIILPLIPSIIILKTINTHIIGQIIITSLVYLGLYVLLLYLTKVFYPGEITIIKNKFRFLKKEAT